MFLGYPTNQNGYKFYNLLTHSEFVSRDAMFYEHIFPYAAKSIQQFLNPLPTSLPCQFETSSKFCDDFDSFQVPDVLNQTTPEPVQVSSSVTHENDNSQSTTSSVPPQSQVPTRKSTRTTTVPSKLKDFVLSHIPKANQVSQTPFIPNFQDFICTLLAQKDPVNFKQAIVNPQWCKAMDVELKALDDNDTWEMTELPEGKTAIGAH